VLDKARFWRLHSSRALLPAQVKVLNRLLDGGPGNFEEGINASQYQRVTRVSKATATRHLADLLALGCLKTQPGRGRSTRYRIQR
jgi:Fic family protein